MFCQVFKRIVTNNPKQLIKPVTLTPKISEIERKCYRTVPEIPKALYGGRYTVTMLPGAGIGPELMGYVKMVFRHLGVPVDFEEISIAPDISGNEDLEYALTSIKRNGAVIKGNIETFGGDTQINSRNIAIRNELDLYINVIECKPHPALLLRHSDIDIVMIRQNTEGEYSMLEHEIGPGIVQSLKISTASNAERVCRRAFDYATANGRRKVTTVHQSHRLTYSDGLFLEMAYRVAMKYPNILHDDINLDTCSLKLIQEPQEFDVLNLTNLYGNIISNIVCGIAGGAGLYSGKNFGRHYAMFEPATRNTGTTLKGTNSANPIAMLNASVNLLEYLGLHSHAILIKNGIYKTMSDRKLHTHDLGGPASSMDVIDNILKVAGFEEAQQRKNEMI